MLVVQLFELLMHPLEGEFLLIITTSIYKIWLIWSKPFTLQNMPQMFNLTIPKNTHTRMNVIYCLVKHFSFMIQYLSGLRFSLCGGHIFLSLQTSHTLFRAEFCLVWITTCCYTSHDTLVLNKIWNYWYETECAMFYTCYPIIWTAGALPPQPSCCE